MVPEYLPLEGVYGEFNRGAAVYGYVLLTTEIGLGNEQTVRTHQSG
jgi:hypothetical protein